MNGDATYNGTNNLLWFEHQDAVDYEGTGGTFNNASDIFGQNPLFVTPPTTPGTGNFQLREGSPAADAGVNAGLTDDIEGNARPSGAGYDIGAYEADLGPQVNAVGRWRIY